MVATERRREEIRFSWQAPDGTPCRVTLFDVTSSEAEVVAKACGWPGALGGQNRDANLAP